MGQPSPAVSGTGVSREVLPAPLPVVTAGAESPFGAKLRK